MLPAALWYGFEAGPGGKPGGKLLLALFLGFRIDRGDGDDFDNAGSGDEHDDDVGAEVGGDSGGQGEFLGVEGSTDFDRR